jgi:hypothetical protein
MARRNFFIPFRREINMDWKATIAEKTGIPISEKRIKSI